MKTLIWLFAFLILSGASVAQKPTDVSINGLIRKVKRFDERSSTITEKNGKQKEEKSGFEKALVFDEDGRLTLETSTGTSISETRFLYAKDGVRKAVTERTDPFEKPGKIKIPDYSASKFTYDEKENSILEETFRGKLQAGPVLELAGRSHQYKFHFDQTNRLLKKEFLTPDGKELMIEEYFYRGTGPTATDVVLSHNGQALQFIKCTYEVDKAGNWTKRTEVQTPIDPRNSTVTEITYRKIAYYKD
jgi:hypothetical protein